MLGLKCRRCCSVSDYSSLTLFDVCDYSQTPVPQGPDTLITHSVDHSRSFPSRGVSLSGGVWPRSLCLVHVSVSPILGHARAPLALACARSLSLSLDVPLVSLVLRLGPRPVLAFHLSSLSSRLNRVSARLHKAIKQLGISRANIKTYFFNVFLKLLQLFRLSQSDFC